MTNNRTDFSHSFTATELGARAALYKIMEDVRATGLAEEQLGGVEIALAEVVNNIVEHVYCGLAPGEISLLGAVDQNMLTITIHDWGKALPKEKIPEGNPADLNGPVADLPEGGFGWFMIRTLARDIRYLRQRDRNQLQLSFDLIPPIT